VVFADFVQFAAMYLIFVTMLRLLQGRFQGTEFGKVLAFYG
jgi:hypothetical protein